MSEQDHNPSAEGADAHRVAETAVVAEHLTAAYDLVLSVGRMSHDQDDGGNDYDLGADHDRLQRLIEQARDIMSLPSTSRRRATASACPVCDGVGELQIDDLASRSCPRCHGSGMACVAAPASDTTGRDFAEQNGPKGVSS